LSQEHKRAAESTGFQNSRSRTEQEQGGSTESQRSNRVTNGSRGLLLVIAQAGATVCWWSQRGLVVARADATGFGGRDWKSDLSSRRQVTQPGSDLVQKYLFCRKSQNRATGGLRFISLPTSDSSEGNRGCGEEQGRDNRRLAARRCRHSRGMFFIKVSGTLTKPFPPISAGVLWRNLSGEHGEGH
ncbi:hypothetical protein U1Q18_046741, partial [Sarracenia purpurea var. burkii]